MARRTGSDMDDEILMRVANRTDISSVQRGFFLRDALYWCAGSFEHKDLEQTTTATQVATTDLITPLATDVLYVETLRSTTDNRVIMPGDKDIIEDITKPAGNPTKFYHWGNLLYTERLPTENKAYKIWYIQKPDPIADDDVSPLDEMFDIVLIMKAAEIALTTVRDYKEAYLQETQINNHITEFRLPRRMNRYNRTNAGIRMRTK